MKELLFGTKNPAKLAQFAQALATLDIHVTGLDQGTNPPDVAETGSTVAENAELKARSYARFFNTRVMSADNGLYITGLTPQDQPGLNVRRLPGRVDRPSDADLLIYYAALITKLGGEVSAHWEYGICVADPNGDHWTTTLIEPRIMTNKPSDKRIEGYPLESLQIIPESGKSMSEMTPDEKSSFWQQSVGVKLRTFVETTIPWKA